MPFRPVVARIYDAASRKQRHITVGSKMRARELALRCMTGQNLSCGQFCDRRAIRLHPTPRYFKAPA